MSTPPGVTPANHVELAIGRERGRRLLGADEVGCVDRPDRTPVEASHQGVGLPPADLVETRAGKGGVQEPGDIGGGLAVADEVEAHGPTLGGAAPSPRC